MIFFTFNLNDSKINFIASDGFAYFAYLPATYIYQDFDYSFIDFEKEKYDFRSYIRLYLLKAGAVVKERVKYITIRFSKAFVHQNLLSEILQT